MPVFMLSGTVTDCGAASADGNCLAIAYVEIQGRAGTCARLRNIAAAPELASILRIGTSGRFFFRDAGSSHRLLGIERADGLQAFDLQDVTVRTLNDYLARAVAPSWPDATARHRAIAAAPSRGVPEN